MTRVSSRRFLGVSRAARHSHRHHVPHDEVIVCVFGLAEETPDQRMGGVLAGKFSRELGQHSEKFRWCDELCSRVTPLVQEFPVGCDQIGSVAVHRCLY